MRALSAAAKGHFAFVDVRNTAVTDGALIGFDSDLSSMFRPREQFSGILLCPRASVRPSGVWYEKPFRNESGGAMKTTDATCGTAAWRMTDPRTIKPLTRCCLCAEPCFLREANQTDGR